MRDPEWVIRGLWDEMEEQRYTAAACLAFVSAPEVVAALRQRLEDEPSSLVRSALLWSLGLHLVGTGTLAGTVSEYLSRETNEEVRRILETAELVIGDGSEFAWWML